MENLKILGTSIQQATSDVHSQPPIQLYQKILQLINSRVDMPKHAINAISKRLTIKNPKVLFYCFDLLEFLSFRCELSLYSQISTKQFLLKLSALLMSQIDERVKVKMLQTIKCWQNLFRNNQDLLPMFFQFYAGLLRKQFPIKHDYVSPHQPKDFKVNKIKSQPAKQQKVSKPKVQASIAEQKVFQQIRVKILLTNQIIDNSNPAEGVKSNEILLQMMQQIKKCQKRINQTINQNPNQKIMELALAANDDIFITYRRFKDLQKNRKPQPFVFTQLASDVQQQKKFKQTKKQQKKQLKKQQKPKKVTADIFDIACQPVDKKQSPKKQIDLMDMNSPVQPIVSNNNNNIFQLLGNNPPVQQQQPLVSQGFNLQSNNYLGMQTSNIGQPMNLNNITLNSNNFASNVNNIPNIQANISLGSNHFPTQNDIQNYNSESLIDKLTNFNIGMPEFGKK